MVGGIVTCDTKCGHSLRSMTSFNCISSHLTSLTLADVSLLSAAGEWVSGESGQPVIIMWSWSEPEVNDLLQLFLCS